MLFPTTLVGSYPQPDWLIDRERLMRYLPREVAFGKLKAMVAGAQIVRSQLQSERESSPTGAIL